MTVIEVSLNRQRPGLVRKELESPREGREVIPRRKRKSSDGDFMQQIQGCAFGDFLGGDLSTVGSEHQVESRLFRYYCPFRGFPANRKEDKTVDI